MIAFLRGEVASVAPGQVVLDVGGVGYRVLVTAGMPVAVGQAIMLHTHLAVREDAHTLYGFADADARDAFETLLSVSKVGPKLALAALSTLGAQGLRSAVATQDIDALTAIPGVGRKGAQRLLLELRERLGTPHVTAPEGPGVADGEPGGTLAEVREALAALGYAPAEVRAVTADLAPEADAGPEYLLRRALRALDGARGAQPARAGGR